MRTYIAAIFGCSLLAACATEVSLPITGQMSDGTAAGGTATARTSGNGSFWVKIPAGPRCGGTYDSRSYAPTLIVPVACDDGRSGEAVITRQMDMVSGTAIVSLTDGTTGNFVFGNLSFDQAFGPGGTARTAPLPRRS